MTDMKIKNRNVTRSIVLLAVVGVAFFGAFQFAQARSAGNPKTGQTAGGGLLAAVAGADGAPACACCGTGAPTANGITGDPVEGVATRTGDVQTIDVDLSTGIYNPNVIVLEAGVPAEVTFGQSSGCTGQVMSKDLGFFEDLTTGAKTVKLPALEPGEYAFECGMSMVFGKIVVK